MISVNLTKHTLCIFIHFKNLGVRYLIKCSFRFFRQTTYLLLNNLVNLMFYHIKLCLCQFRFSTALHILFIISKTHNNADNNTYYASRYKKYFCCDHYILHTSLFHIFTSKSALPCPFTKTFPSDFFSSVNPLHWNIHYYSYPWHHIYQFHYQHYPSY